MREVASGALLHLDLTKPVAPALNVSVSKVDSEVVRLWHSFYYRRLG